MENINTYLFLFSVVSATIVELLKPKGERDPFRFFLISMLCGMFGALS